MSAAPPTPPPAPSRGPSTGPPPPPRPPRGGGLYLHLPFCASICPYCHFARTAVHDAAARRRLSAAIAGEFALRRRRCAALGAGRVELSSVYVGGGTPSLLEPELLAGLLAGTAGRLPAAPDLEVTAEANPDSFTPAVAAAWQAAGVNRVSLGVQSLDDRALRALGRRHDAAAARAALRLAATRFPRVAADWLLGPGLRRGPLLSGLREAVGEGVGHVSLYLVEVRDGTPLAADLAAGRARLPSEGTLAGAYLAAAALLESLGLRQYEVANFARPGQESRHNAAYWRGSPYLGLGPGAHGFWGRRRYANLADPAAYAAAVAAGRLPEASVDRLDRRARRLERLILPLRTAAGVPLADLPPGALPLARGAARGLWRVAGGRLTLTARGFLQIDGIESMLARALQVREE